MRFIFPAAVAFSIACAPAQASDEEPLLSAAPRPTYNPWLAAGLTYAPIVGNATLAAFATGITSPTVLSQSGIFIAMNPLPGLGHLYVREPVRGLAFFGTNLGLLVGSVVANVMLYTGRHPEGVAVPPQESMRNGVNLTYFAASSLISAWAAYDAFRLAEEKNAAISRQAHD